VGGGGGGAALITLTTDFGLADPWVGIMKGVIASRAPGTPVVDVSHGIPPQDVLAGALVLRHAVPWFPAAPPAAVRRIVELTEERFFLTPRSRTFHGRDVFAPVAAALATGTDPGALGQTRGALVRLTLPEPERHGTTLQAQVIYVDRFGNLVTNVPGDAFAPDRVSISIASARIRGIATSYAAAARGTLVAVINSWNLLEIAVRDGSAQERLGVGAGAPLTLDEA
jgi:S-adenosylmethionine hydrolase